MKKLLLILIAFLSILSIRCTNNKSANKNNAKKIIDSVYDSFEKKLPLSDLQQCNGEKLHCIGIDSVKEETGEEALYYDTLSVIIKDNHSYVNYKSKLYPIKYYTFSNYIANEHSLYSCKDSAEDYECCILNDRNDTVAYCTFKPYRYWLGDKWQLQTQYLWIKDPSKYEHLHLKEPFRKKNIEDYSFGGRDYYKGKYN